NDETVYAYQRDFMDSRADNPLPDADIGPVPVSTLRISRTNTNTPNTYFAPPAGTCARFGGEYVDYTFRTRYSATSPLAGQIYTLGNAC
ncbi:hypothetical protein Q0M89_14315, partial [Staphylococcus aureus]|nr:hypothetical protein [Staphylococcus aureus]